MSRIRVTPPFFIVSLALFLNAFASVHGTDGDAYGTLLVSDSILRFGSLSLEHYPSSILDLYGPRIRITNGLPYYYFPLGTALLSLPFVALADHLGFNVVVHDAAVQRVISGLSSALTLILMVCIAKRLRKDDAYWLVPSIFWFGTALSTTTGMALESHNFAIVFALVAIQAVLRIHQEPKKEVWWVIGISIFFAYLTRPTFSIFAVYLLIWIFTISRSTALKSFLLLLSLLAIFILFSLHAYGQILPDYYLPKRLEGGNPSLALIGNLISPARGIWVFSPFLLTVLLFLPRHQTGWGRAWLTLGVLWPLTHLFVISRFPHWWGGHSYGPRLMIDCLPGLFLTTLYLWPTPSLLSVSKLRAFILVISVVFSCYVNVWQGFYNPYTADWSNAPDIDDYPEYLFDWRYPLFLANERGHRRRAIEFKAKYHKDAWTRREQLP